jgi:hypothetical protein
LTNRSDSTVRDVASQGRGKVVESKKVSGATQVPAPSTTTVLSLDVPEGSYLFIAKGALAKAGNTLISCTTTAGADSDTSLSHIAADANDTIVNTVVHTFDAAGTAEFACQNPAGNPLFVTNAKLTAIPFADLENAPAP